MRTNSWQQYQVNVPPGASGDWSVERFTVAKDDLSQFLSMMKTGRGVPGGDYTRLMRKSTVVMSDTPDEIRDHYFLLRAKGRWLVHGLGLGVGVGMLLKQPEVEHVDVVEQSEDVIKLVGKHYACDRLTIWHGDAYVFRFPDHAARRWDGAWHDIWDTICEDNLPLMTKLHRRYAKKVEKQESWARQQCRSLARRGRSYHGWF